MLSTFPSGPTIPGRFRTLLFLAALAITLGHVGGVVFGSGVSSCSKAPEERGFDSDGIARILERHNNYRRQILMGKVKGLPRAKEMPDLEWDEKLEKEAQRWADTCPNYFHGVAHPPSSWMAFPYSQNVGWGQGDVNEVIDQWFDEYKPYVENNEDPLIYRGPEDPVRRALSNNTHDMAIGHFTLMVSAKTTKIGCGVVRGVVDFRTIYVCNYLPQGNIILIDKEGKMNPLPAYEVAEDGTEGPSGDVDDVKPGLDKTGRANSEAPFGSEGTDAKKGQVETEAKDADDKSGGKAERRGEKDPKRLKVRSSLNRHRDRKSRKDRKPEAGAGNRGYRGCKTLPKARGLSSQEKSLALNLHNHIRRLILDGKVEGLPKAKDMAFLRWDRKLEVEAQRWAEHCPDYSMGMDHPPTWQKLDYGQNVAWGPEDEHIDSVIKKWFWEFKPYVDNNVDPLIVRPGSEDPVSRQLSRDNFRPGNLNFSQLVNAETTRIGCGAVRGVEGQGSIFVCNYSPPGNVVLHSKRRQLSLPAYETDSRRSALRSHRKRDRNQEPKGRNDKPEGRGDDDQLADGPEEVDAMLMTIMQFVRVMTKHPRTETERKMQEYARKFLTSPKRIRKGAKEGNSQATLSEPKTTRQRRQMSEDSEYQMYG